MTETEAAKPKAASGSDDGDEVPPMSHAFKVSMFSISLTSFIGSVSAIVITPTLIFYLRQLGGTDAQYGRIMSAGPLASFVTTPLFGAFIDSHSGQYRRAWLFGDTLVLLGNLLYAFAVVFGASDRAIHAIFLSRILNGAGRGTGSIGMNWLTEMADLRHLNFCMVVMSAAGTAGSALGPFVNTLISGLDFDLRLFGTVVPVNANNGAGLIVAFLEFVAMLLTWFFVRDPPPREEGPDAASRKPGSVDEGDDDAREEGGWTRVLWAMTSYELFLPVFASFVVMANVTVVDSAFPPAVAHALGWGPVQVSAVMGLNSLTYFVLTAAVMALTVYFTDTAIVLMGFLLWFAAGVMVDLWWIDGSPAWKFVAPLVIGIAGLPLIGPSNQTLFSRAVMARDDLAPCQGRLQSMYTMAASLGGFVTPAFVGALVLRSPEEIDGGDDPRELTRFDLYIAVFSGACILGFLYERYAPREDDDAAAEDAGEGVLSERSSLLRGQAAPEKRHSSIKMVKRELLHRSHTTENVLARSNMGGCVSSMLVMPESQEEKDLVELLKELEAEEEELEGGEGAI